MKSDRVIAILERSLNMIQRGWCQGHLSVCRTRWFTVPVDNDSMFANCYCAIGAMTHAAHGINPYVWANHLPEFNKAIDYLLGEIGQEWLDRETLFVLNPLLAWNDHHERTKDEVVAVFRQALNKASQELGRG